METVSIKLEENLAKDMATFMRKHRYATKTEFIREAIRDKMLSIEQKEALLHLQKLRGSSKHRTTDEDLHRVREELFDELERSLK